MVATNLDTDENKTIARLVLEPTFRESMKANMEKTISEAGYTLSPEFVSKLKGVNLDNLAESKVADIQPTLQDLTFVQCW